MAEWNPNPSWTPKEQINGGQSFASLEEVSASDINKLVENIQYIYVNGGDFDMSNYPVGAIYISTVNISPASLFGGRWTPITDKFLLGAGSIYAAGSTGGSATVTLSSDQLPSHTHIVGSELQSNNIYLNATTTGGSGNGASVAATYGWGTFKVPTNESGRLKAIDSESTRGEAHNNMPPYLAVYMWERTA